MNKLIVVTSYPEKGLIHGKKTVGVASYAKNTILGLSTAGKEKLDITVLAEKLPGQKDEYQEDNVTVIRCWQRNSWSAYWQIAKEIKKINAEKVMIEFEMAMFGSSFKNILFPLLLLWLKLINKKTFVVTHQVVLDFGKLSGHLGAEKENLKTKILSLVGKIFFKSILITAGQVIVFEKFLKNRLAKLGNSEKISVIPHGVEPDPITTTQSESRKKLNIPSKDFVITMFGYLAWYKGTDWLVKTIANYLKDSNEKNLKLIIAGGPNPNHVGKDYYDKYIQKIKDAAGKYPEKITITGFVDEKDIPLYFKSSDVLVFPYRTGMSSSGPLAFAFTNHKPFLVSKPLSPLLETEDIKSTLNQFDLSIEQIAFSLSEKDFIDKINFLKNNNNLQDKLSQASKIIAQKRTWPNIGKSYSTLLFE